MNLIKKNFGEFVTIFIFALLILIAYYSFTCDKQNNEHFGNESYAPVKWNRNKCEYVLGDTLETELKKNGISRSNDSWDLYFPCGYDDIKKEIEEMEVLPNAKYFIINNCDEMVAKEWLWINVKNHYGRDYARTILPNSYVLYDTNDLKLFDKEYDKSKIYIMKKNIQRQEGLKITNDKNEILGGFKNQYVIVQELLQNPYLISGRKTNMRFYVLVVCSGPNLKVYVHNDGFMYYTKVPFKLNSLEIDPNVTTGYIERQVYKENPLTHDDLREYLDNPIRQNLLDVEKVIRAQGLKVSQVCFSRIYQTLRTIFTAFVGRICKPSKLYNNVSFQLFGVDVAVDNNLNVSIMEINKGPDLNAKDDRDSELKHGVVQDILKLIGTFNDPTLRDPKFVKILDVEDGVILKNDL
jgi:hypothetical protein